MLAYFVLGEEGGRAHGWPRTRTNNGCTCKVHPCLLAATLSSPLTDAPHDFSGVAWASRWCYSEVAPLPPSLTPASNKPSKRLNTSTLILARGSLDQVTNSVGAAPNVSSRGVSSSQGHGRRYDSRTGAHPDSGRIRPSKLIGFGAPSCILLPVVQREGVVCRVAGSREDGCAHSTFDTVGNKQPPMML